MLVGASGCALSQTHYKSFEHIFFNHFLKLNGSKFSTSRGHVIWTGDIAGTPGLNTDLLRVYLSEICPEDAGADLQVSALIHRHNELLIAICSAPQRCSAID